MSNFLQPHGLQQARPPYPLLSPRACSNSCPLSQWCHPTISSSIVPFSSCLQSLPASGLFLTIETEPSIYPKEIKSLSWSNICHPPMFFSLPTKVCLVKAMVFPVVNPNGNQSWIFTGRTDAEAETTILWLPDVKNWLMWKDPDAGKDWRQEEKWTTEDEMVGWHHRLDGWTWVWANSRSWWWTGRPVVLQSIGLQRVSQEWATELNWTVPGAKGHHQKEGQSYSPKEMNSSSSSEAGRLSEHQMNCKPSTSITA